MSDTPIIDPIVENFNAEELTSNFEKCANQGDVPLYEFIQAFENLVLLLNRLGSVFSFITSDINDKLKLIRDKRLKEATDNAGQCQKYVNLVKMVESEKGTFDPKVRPSKSNPPTGTRQMQLLQRAMKMLYLFMLKIANNDCNGKVSTMAWEAYSDSPLPKFHPWLVRNTVKIAVYTLPSRDQFYKQTCPELTEEEITDYLSRASKAMDTIFNQIEEIYAKENLLNLA